MIIQNEEDLNGLRTIGRIVAEIRDAMAKALKPGISSLELDQVCGKMLAAAGAKSAPKECYDFPGYSCISINEVACHGVPDRKAIQAGDFVNIDVSAEKDGYFADTGLTMVCGQASEDQIRHLEASQKALLKGIEAARPGRSTATVGKAIFKSALASGYTVLKNLTGHGIGRSLHEEPHYIFNYNERQGASLLKEGMVLAIETFLSDKDEWVEENPEGVWPMVTANKSQVVQFEHTIVVRKEGPLILTDSPFFQEFIRDRK